MLNEGDLAPDFELETYGGDTLKLSDLRGRKVVLYFYPKDDTSGCTKEACGFRDKYDLNFPLLSDPEHEVAEAYGAWGTKKMYGREYQGILRSTFVIDPEGRVEKVYAKVKPAEHAVQVVSDLSA